MKKLNFAFVFAFFGVMLAACSTASGPTYSASEYQPRDGVRIFQVDCNGLFSGSKTCMNAARMICGKLPVHVLESVSSPRDASNPKSIVFQCGETPVAKPETPNMPISPAINVPAPVAVERVSLSGDALFETDHSTLMPNARASLDKLLSEHRGRTYSQAEITGHTDSIGSVGYNLMLSMRRAQSVAGYLKSHGLKVNNMKIKGRGKADPVASNATVEGRASNRRVEILLVD
ncbi:OmpA family protein [Burkholderia cepacia]|uniref:OmpA family protein n=1 Tax=Burkholderia cepacia TaxID=292 RepID=UPI0009C00885|nr:OmpA family protein [Burkholderia cepacia]